MSRYIDATLVKSQFTGNFQEQYTVPLIKTLIDEVQTADVQEVVRCKDCKYSYKEKPVFGITDYSCQKLGIHCLSANDFCSYGAKMDEEEQE